MTKSPPRRSGGRPVASRRKLHSAVSPAGLVLGTASALVLGRVLAAQFPRSLVLASAALASAAAASAASWLLARRAARIDPLEALRQE